MPHPLRIWIAVRNSLWFVPTVVTLISMAVAHGLVEAGAHVRWLTREQLPTVFAFSAEGSREMLSSVATAMITIAGVAFSITIVVLSLTSTQYSPRVLRQFMRDRANQWVLGVFVGVFAYCLTVLPRVRGEGAHEFVPAVAVLGGLLYALAGVCCLIFFIHHIATSIQASHIVSEVAAETRITAEALFGTDEEPAVSAVEEPPGAWAVVTANVSGYIQLLDEEQLIAVAAKHDLTLRLEHGVGEFVVADTPLIAVAKQGRAFEPPQDVVARLRRAFAINRTRTIEQDVMFGIRQIVDVALRALSPSLNDPTTACICTDYLTTILLPLANRRLGKLNRVRDGKLRLIVCEPTFHDMLALAFGEIRANAGAQVLVLRALLRGLAVLARSPSPDARAALLIEAQSIGGVISRIENEPLVSALCAECERLIVRLRAGVE